MSPNGVHVTPPVHLALHQALTEPPSGTIEASSDDLAGIVTAALRRDRSLTSLLDWVPLDPHLAAPLRVGANICHLLPGDVDRPLAAHWRARLVGEVVDSTLRRRVGFGIADVSELLARHAEATVEHMRPAWPERIVSDPSDPPSVTASEVDATGRLPQLPDVATRCSDPAAAAAACRWLTSRADRLRFDVHDANSCFGTAMHVAGPGADWTLPASIGNQTLLAATSELAALAADTDPGNRRRWAKRATATATRLLSRLPNLPDIGTGEPKSPLFVAPFGDRSFLAVSIAATLTPQADERVLVVAREALDTIRAGSNGIPADAVIARLVVLATPAHIMGQARGAATMTLDELDWITARTTETDDLWWFCRDVTAPRGIKTLFGWETINVFEHWRDYGGTFLRSGSDYDFAYVEAHRGDAEWLLALEREPLEVTAAACGLPALHAWDHVEADDDGSAALTTRAGAVALLRPVIQSAVVHDHGNDPEGFAAAVARTVHWKLGRPAIAALVPPNVRVDVVWSDDESATVSADVGSLVVGRAGFDACTADHVAGDAAIGDAFAAIAGGSGDAAAQLIDAWRAEPPGIRMDGYSVAQTVRQLPIPQQISSACRATCHQLLVRHLRAAGATPGRYTEADARDLENRAGQFVLGRLREMIGRYDQAALVELALRECQRSHAGRYEQERKLAFTLRLPVPDVNAADATQDLLAKFNELSRAQAIVLEETLRSTTSGRPRPDRMDWAQLLATASEYLASATRSEGIHVGVEAVDLELADDFDLRVVDADRPALIDAAAYSAARVRWNPISSRPPDLHDDERDSAAEEDDAMGTLLDVDPDLTPIDAALLASKGTSLLTLMAVVSNLRTWPDEVEVAWTSPEKVVAWLCEILDDHEADQIRAAVETITLTAAKLGTDDLEHWELDRRPARLITHPLVARGDGRIGVAPWLLQSTLRLFMNHVFDGRLPWGARNIDANLRAATDTYRQRRNRQLERDATAAATTTGMPLMANVADAPRLGLGHLSGEIDLIVVDSSSRVIWVCEVKDPAEALGHAAIRNLVEDFHGTSGKRYVAKLLAKAADVAADPDAVARAVDPAAPADQWTVKAVMVTRRPVAAAFVPNPSVPFCIVEELTAVLTG